MTENVSTGDPGVHVGVRGRRVLIAGATSVSGEVVCGRLLDAGAHVYAVGRDEEKVAVLSAKVPGVHVAVCDLTDETAVSQVAGQLRTEHGPMDGVLNLVGGWRGGGGIPGQSEADYRALEVGLTALRNVSRAFFDDLAMSSAGRLAIISTKTLERPLAGGANYAAVKAASEAWVRAVAHGFAKVARDENHEVQSAACILRVASLGGREDDMARWFTNSWNKPADALNGTITTLE